jgi:arylsulfatase A-like enzyme
MNFIVIMNDTLRPDYLSAYGNDWVKTPTAAQFAKDGAVFEKAFCASWPTIPNRTDLFTGRYGEPLHPWLPLDYGETTLPRLLGEQGYVTQLICDCPHLVQGGGNFDYPFHAWDFIRGQEVDRLGMDHFDVEFPFKDHSKVHTHSANRLFAQYLRNVRGRRHEEDWATYKTYQSAVNWLDRNYKHEKFFLWIDGFDPHEPPWPPQQYTDMYDPGYEGDAFLTFIKAEKLTDAELNHLRARYAGTVTFVDKQVGRVLNKLDELGIADNTCVVWVSDHGTHIGEHGRAMGKTCAYDEVARTVMMIRPPKGLCAGKRFSELVQPPDVAPTLLELAGLDIPERMQGVSFAPLLRGEKCKIRDVAITGHMPRKSAGQWNFIGARDGRWVFNDPIIRESRELFDTDADPGQLNNVIADHPDVAERLHNAVIEFLRNSETPPALLKAFETGDIDLLKGFVFPRPGFEDFNAYFSYLYNQNVFPE